MSMGPTEYDRGYTDGMAQANAAQSALLTITTAQDLDRVPAQGVVRSSAGTIACRFDGRNGVVFGDDRPFPWHKLALPAQLIWHPAWAT